MPQALLLTFCILLASGPLVAVEGGNSAQAEDKAQVPLGFQSWKQERIDKAREDLREFKKPQELEKASNDKPEIDEKSEENQDLEVKKTERLRQLEFNLEIALGLTIHDYFALYLKDKSKQEMALAVGQLEPEELSELLVSYRDALYGAPLEEKESPQTSLK